MVGEAPPPQFRGSCLVGRPSPKQWCTPKGARGRAAGTGAVLPGGGAPDSGGGSGRHRGTSVAGRPERQSMAGPQGAGQGRGSAGGREGDPGLTPCEGQKVLHHLWSSASAPARTSPKIPGSLWGCGSSLVFFSSRFRRGLTARGARMGLGLALKNVTMKGCWERGARRPSRPARPGSTLRPETERGERAVTGAAALHVGTAAALPGPGPEHQG